MKQMRLMCITTAFLIMLSCTNLGYAQEINPALEIQVNAEQTRGDVIQKKYRVYDGHFQYRHWNLTQGCWVEDHWINLT